MKESAASLMSYMSDLSEEAYSTGWMHGLEYALWHAVKSGPESYGRLSIDQEEIQRLIDLSKQCGGWMYFDDELGETWIAEHEWKHMFDLNKANYPMD